MKPQPMCWPIFHWHYFLEFVGLWTLWGGPLGGGPPCVMYVWAAAIHYMFVSPFGPCGSLWALCRIICDHVDVLVHNFGLLGGRAMCILRFWLLEAELNVHFTFFGFRVVELNVRFTFLVSGRSSLMCIVRLGYFLPMGKTWTIMYYMRKPYKCTNLTRRNIMYNQKNIMY